MDYETIRKLMSVASRMEQLESAGLMTRPKNAKGEPECGIVVVTKPYLEQFEQFYTAFLSAVGQEGAQVTGRLSSDNQLNIVEDEDT